MNFRLLFCFPQDGLQSDSTAGVCTKPVRGSLVSRGFNDVASVIGKVMTVRLYKLSGTSATAKNAIYGKLHHGQTMKEQYYIAYKQSFLC